MLHRSFYMDTNRIYHLVGLVGIAIESVAILRSIFVSIRKSQRVCKKFL